jgi:hypothetical protein
MDYCEYVLNTICGGIHYDLSRYGRKEILACELEQLIGFLHIISDSIYNVQLDTRDFIFTTASPTLRYIHDDLHDKRRVEITAF